MSEALKQRVKAALDRHFERTQKPKAPRLKKNAKPEAVVETQLLAYMRGLGWSMDKVEAKAVFSKKANRYLRGPAAPGFSDLVGNMPDGRAVFVEVKAPGRRSSLREEQRVFLSEKIGTNAFAVVVDSVARLEELLAGFKRSSSPKAYLLNALPIKQAPSKDDEFGF